MNKETILILLERKMREANYQVKVSFLRQLKSQIFFPKIVDFVLNSIVYYICVV